MSGTSFDTLRHRGPMCYGGEGKMLRLARRGRAWIPGCSLVAVPSDRRGSRSYVHGYPSYIIVAHVRLCSPFHSPDQALLAVLQPPSRTRMKSLVRARTGSGQRPGLVRKAVARSQRIAKSQVQFKHRLQARRRRADLGLALPLQVPLPLQERSLLRMS